MIQTITKKIKINQTGNILAHEHLNMNLDHIRKDGDSVLNDNKLLELELKCLLQQGFKTIVELSNQNMHSNQKHILQLAKKLKLNIVVATGYYLHEYHDDNFKKRTVDDIANEFIQHIEQGFKGTNIKAGIIGEIATSSAKVFASEKRVFLAAAKAHKKTGCPIYTHSNFGHFAEYQAQLLIANGVNPKKIVIGHIDLINDLTMIEKVLQEGVNIGFDTIGKNQYQADALRVQNLLELIKRGYQDRIVLSLDISRKSYFKSFGGHGYGYLMETFFNKMLKTKISKKVWEKLIRINMANVLNF